MAVQSMLPPLEDTATQPLVGNPEIEEEENGSERDSQRGKKKDKKDKKDKKNKKGSRDGNGDDEGVEMVEMQDL